MIKETIRKPNRRIKKHTKHVELKAYRDVRTSDEHREHVEILTKLANGDSSKYIPGKWGYGSDGQKKY